jgi:hypothetical protein
MPNRTMTLSLDEDDWEAIQAEIARRQAASHAAYGETLLPEGDSCLAGALIAEMVRDLEDYRSLYNASHPK